MFGAGRALSASHVRFICEFCIVEHRVTDHLAVCDGDGGGAAKDSVSAMIFEVWR